MNIGTIIADDVLDKYTDPINIYLDADEDIFSTIYKTLQKDVNDDSQYEQVNNFKIPFVNTKMDIMEYRRMRRKEAEEFWSNVSDEDKQNIIQEKQERTQRNAERVDLTKRVVAKCAKDSGIGILWLLIFLVHAARFIGLGLILLLLPYEVFKWAMRENKTFNSRMGYAGNKSKSDSNYSKYMEDKYSGINGAIKMVLAIVKLIAWWCLSRYLGKVGIYVVLGLILYALTPIYKIAKGIKDDKDNGKVKNKKKKKKKNKDKDGDKEDNKESEDFHELSVKEITEKDINYRDVERYMKKHNLFSRELSIFDDSYEDCFDAVDEDSEFVDSVDSTNVEGYNTYSEESVNSEEAASVKETDLFENG